MVIYKSTIIGRRESNEDRDYVRLNINNTNDNYYNFDLLGVFDGHGGNKISNYLKNNISILHKKNNDLSFIYKDSIHVSFNRANFSIDINFLIKLKILSSDTSLYAYHSKII